MDLIRIRLRRGFRRKKILNADFFVVLRPRAAAAIAEAQTFLNHHSFSEGDSGGASFGEEVLSSLSSPDNYRDQSEPANQYIFDRFFARW